MKPERMSPIRVGESLIALLMAIGLQSCQSTPPAPYACTLPSGYNVAQAFAHANRDLAHPACQYNFENYFDHLLTIAATNPGQDNRRHFSQFLSQARDNDVIGQLQAQRYYQRYFTPNFVTLEDQHNNCSTTCRNQNRVMKELKNELRDKRRGLLEAAADRQAYAQADKEFNELLTLIEATCLACVAGP